MTRSRSPRHLISSISGAVTALLVLSAISPTGAQAGCSHLVTSRNDPGRDSTLIEPLLRDLTGRADPASVPMGQGPCTGAWCSGQAAVPSVPPGTFEGRLGSWALCTPIPQQVSLDPSPLADASEIARPLQRGNEVFHPPRAIPSI